MSVELGEEEIKAIKEKFETADENGDGLLQREEIKKLWEKDLGTKMTSEDLDIIMKDLDTDRDGNISIDELIEGIKKMMAGDL